MDQHIIKDFLFDETFKCDRCYGHHFKSLSFESILTIDDDKQQLEDKLSKYYIDYKESCKHKICFYCLEKYSEHYELHPKDIECPKCQSNAKLEKEKEKENDCCKCPKLEKRSQENYIDTESKITYLNYKVASMFMEGGYSGFPIIDNFDKCNKCNKMIK